MMKTNDKPKIYWSQLADGGWSIYLAATSKGLCFAGSQNKPFEELSAWAKARFPESELIQDENRLKPYKDEMVQYLQGMRKQFGIPVHIEGTSFQLAVWEALCAIPYGQTMSYSDIANHIGKPASVRAVGAAIGANPVLITVPCHRVIGKNGALTGYRGGLEMKTELLRLEKSKIAVVQ